MRLTTPASSASIAGSDPAALERGASTHGALVPSTSPRRWTARSAALALGGLVLATVPGPVVSAAEPVDAGEHVPGTFADAAQAEAPAAVARASASSDSGFGEKNRFVGRLGYSADGLGQNGSGGSLQTDVPPGAAVRLAHLYGSYYQGTPSQQARTIRFGGQDVELTTIPTNAGSYLSAARADVTAQVTAAFAAGTRSFRIDDDPGGLDGVALLVVYEDPSLPVSTIAVVDGGAAQSGQRTTLTFGAPLDPAAAGFTATMSLGIGYGYQGGTPGSTCGTSSRQSSIIDVNDRGLTSCAGHYDDGVGNDGGLIIVGGMGDSTDNPADPVQQPADGRSPRVVDDELYDLKPFVRAGDRTLVVDTLNPSSDDLIFLTVLAISARIETVTSVPVGQTFGTGGSGHGGNPSGYQADPVNSRTGFFTSAMTDAVLPARGPALRLDRTYTSGDDRSSLLGRGWSSTWDTSLVVGRDDVTLVAEDGQRLVYERASAAPSCRRPARAARCGPSRTATSSSARTACATASTAKGACAAGATPGHSATRSSGRRPARSPASSTMPGAERPSPPRPAGSSPSPCPTAGQSATATTTRC